MSSTANFPARQVECLNQQAHDQRVSLDESLLETPLMMYLTFLYFYLSSYLIKEIEQKMAQLIKLH